MTKNLQTTEKRVSRPIVVKISTRLSLISWLSGSTQTGELNQRWHLVCFTVASKLMMLYFALEKGGRRGSQNRAFQTRRIGCNASKMRSF